VFMILL